jgi:hypothetical protein
LTASVFARPKLDGLAHQLGEMLLDLFNRILPEPAYRNR